MFKSKNKPGRKLVKHNKSLVRLCCVVLAMLIDTLWYINQHNVIFAWVKMNRKTEKKKILEPDPLSNKMLSSMLNCRAIGGRWSFQ